MPNNTSIHHFYRILADVYGSCIDEPFNIDVDTDFEDVSIIIVSSLTVLNNKVEFCISYDHEKNKVRTTIWSKLYDEPLAENTFDYYDFMTSSKVNDLFATIRRLTYLEHRMADIAERGVK